MTLGLLDVARALPLAIWLPILVGFFMPFGGALARRVISNDGRATLAVQFATRSGILVGTTLAVLGALATIASARLALEGLLPTAQRVVELALPDVQREWLRTNGDPRAMSALLTGLRATDQRIVSMTVAAYPCDQRCSPAGVSWQHSAAQQRALHDRFDTAPAGRTTTVGQIDKATVVLSRAPLRSAAGNLAGLIIVALGTDSVLSRTERLAWQLVLAALAIAAIAVLATAAAVRGSLSLQVQTLIDRIEEPRAAGRSADSRNELHQLSEKVHQLVRRGVEMETELQERRRVESVVRLAGGIAHEFNNQLFTVLGNAELAAATLSPEAPEQADIRAIETAARRASSLTEKLMQYSGQQLESRRLLTLHEIVEHAMPSLRRLAGSDITLNVSATQCGDGTELHVSATPAHMTQLLLELADNACAAMPNGGSLTIEVDVLNLPSARQSFGLATPAGRFTQLRVTDTGVGMASDAIARVFEPFYSTRPFRAGAGLGLAAVYGIVKAHAGGIEIESAPGTGTSVAVRLPSVSAPLQTHATV